MRRNAAGVRLPTRGSVPLGSKDPPQGELRSWAEPGVQNPARKQAEGGNWQPERSARSETFKY